MGAMVKLSLRSMASHRIRFFLTTFAVLLGVAFVVASFVLTDGLRRTFDGIIENTNAGVDAKILATSEFDEVDWSQRPMDEAMLTIVEGVDGVALAIPEYESYKVIPIGPDGDPVETAGAPIIAAAWTDSPISSVSLVDGEVPDEPNEFAIDISTAEREHLVLGETYDIIGERGREAFTLVGTNRFGEDNTLAGAVLMTFTLDEIQRLDGGEGQLLAISVSAAEGVDTAALIQRIDTALPSTVEVLSGAEATASDQDEVGEILDIFGNVLLAFALVAIFVSTFIISNTFNILLGQRVRQLSLLRALGASSGQVRFSAMFEALVIGVTASVLGLFGGVGLAYVLRGIMNMMGMEMPGLELIIRPRTAIVAMLVGIGVTLFASMSPARRASSISPMAGLRAGFRFGSGEGARRTIVGIGLAAAGALALSFGLFSGSGTAVRLMVLGLGAVSTFVAVSMLAPLFSSPSASFLGAPLEVIPGDKIVGHMARENSARNNKRTASTAAGLMIGLALVAMASVVATSLKTSFRAEMGSTLTSDFLVSHPSQFEFSNKLAEQVDALPEIGSVTAVRYGNVRIDESTRDITAVDLTVMTELLDVNVLAGDPATGSDARHIAVSQDAADDLAVGVGDRLSVQFAETGFQRLTVVAVYENEFLIGPFAMDLAGWDANFSSPFDHTIAASAAPGVDAEVAYAALGGIANEFPQLEFETKAEFQDRVEGQLDSFLIIINVFLGLAIIIALLGITNTTALSVLERTREIGLMRAIGMTRPQTRRLIRFEAGVVSLFGAILGVAVGIGFGWLAVIAIPDSVIDRLAIPGPTLAVYTVIATIAGLVAAYFPARRASKLDILDAIGQL